MRPQEKLLEVNVVAQKLNVSPGTVRNLLRDPDCPLKGVKIGRSIRIYASSVEELLRIGEFDLLNL